MAEEKNEARFLCLRRFDFSVLIGAKNLAS